MDFDDLYGGKKDYFGSEPEALLLKHQGLLSRDLAILDVGAGQGRNALFLARMGLRVDAIDPSRVGMEAVSAAASSDNLPMRTYTCGFETFSPEVESYGAVLLFGMLQILSRKSIDVLLQRVNAWVAADGLVFVTCFTTVDPLIEKYAREWSEIGPGSYADGRGSTRTFLRPGELTTLFPGYKVVDLWGGMGPEHRHDDGPVSRHAMSEAVLRRSPSTAGA